MMMIRSQDRTHLIPLGKVYTVEGNGFYAIYDEPAYGIGAEIGRYASESRCLEILDEIQDKFSFCNHFFGSGVDSDSDYQNWNYGVYQMPEK